MCSIARGKISAGIANSSRWRIYLSAWLFFLFFFSFPFLSSFIHPLRTHETVQSTYIRTIKDTHSTPRTRPEKAKRGVDFAFLCSLYSLRHVTHMRASEYIRRDQGYLWLRSKAGHMKREEKRKYRHYHRTLNLIVSSPGVMSVYILLPTFFSLFLFCRSRTRSNALYSFSLCSHERTTN